MNTVKKHYRIKSRFRFTAFVVIVLLMSVMGVNSMLGFYDASSLTLKEYIDIEICAGDTLWQIAGTYMPPDMDTRKAVHKLCAINDIAADEIYPGQVIKVPVYQ